MRVLVTGSSGLIGSAVVERFDALGHDVVGVDNNARKMFFGAAGDTTSNLERLKRAMKHFRHCALDVRNRAAMDALFLNGRSNLDLVVHCAGQPSHDKSREVPVLDFETNALGTLNLLEATRLYAPGAVFVLMSTNKVYGDAPNEARLAELSTRYDYADGRVGVDETCRIDRSTHSPFGASKLAADVMTQEYGRYFGLRTGVFRLGCVTGAAHAGVELHGFLSHLVRTAVRGGTYTVFGHHGKQVRDNLDARDVASAVEEFAKAPGYGAVYNLGGGRENSISVDEALRKVALKLKFFSTYVSRPRLGDHVCYISNTEKFRKDYPAWRVTYGLEEILDTLTACEAVAA